MLFWFVMVAGLIAGIGYFFSRQDYVGAGVVVLAGLTGLCGLRLRLSGIIAFVVGIIVSAQYTAPAADFIEPTVQEWLKTKGSWSHGLCLAVCGIGITLAITTIIRVATRMVCRPETVLDHFDRMSGYVIGIAQGLVLAVVALGGILVIEPIAQERLDGPKSNAAKDAASRNVAQSVITLANQTRTSALYPLIERTEPFETVPLLKDWKHQVLDFDRHAGAEHQTMSDAIRKLINDAKPAEN